MVQVNEDPSAVVAEVPAPQQRLATAAGVKSSQRQPGQGERQSKTDLASAVKNAARPKETIAKSDSPASTSTAAAKMSLSDSSTTSPKSSPHTQAAIEQALAEIRAASGQSQQSQPGKPTAEPAAQVSHVAETSRTVSDTEPSQASDDRDIDVSSGGLVSASLTDLSDEQSITKNTQATPATHRSDSQSLPTPARPATANDRQIIQQNRVQTTSVSSPNTPTTKQPNAMQVALEESLSHLPKLPDTRGPHHGKTVKRIGTSIAKNQNHPSSSQPDQNATQQVVATESGVQSQETESLASSASVAVTASPPTASSPAEILNSNQVRPASHSGESIPPSTAHSRLERIPTEIPAEPLNTPELFSQLVERLSVAPAGENPAARERRQIVLRHLMVLSGNPDAAIESMQNLNPTEQKYLQSQLMGLWTLIDPNGHPSSGRRITEALPKYRDATRHMAMATDSLSLKNIEFCTEIESYGQIKPFEGNRFVSGQQVILYCEIENFAAAPKNGRYQTQLEGSYDIYNADGTKVFSQLLPMDEQRSRNQLRDYFVAYQMNLPKGLPAGTYRLQLTIEDIVGKKYGQENIPFEIK